MHYARKQWNNIIKVLKENEYKQRGLYTIKPLNTDFRPIVVNVPNLGIIGPLSSC